MYSWSDIMFHVEKVLQKGFAHNETFQQLTGFVYRDIFIYLVRTIYFYIKILRKTNNLYLDIKE